MSEGPFFFPRDDHDLFAVLHLPEGAAPRSGIVLCSPFAEEKLWVHRVYVNFARDAARAGYAVLRFDFMGHGDSSGEFEDATVETRLADVAAAADTLRSRVPALEQVGLLGIRFGATLAAIAAEADPRYAYLVLWEPLVNGARYMQEILRSNLATQMATYREIRHNRQALARMLQEGGTVNAEGYELTGALFEQVSAIDLLEGGRQFRGPVLVVQVGARQGPFKKHNQALAGAYHDGELISAIEEPFWKEIRPYCPKAENLSRVTLDWLARLEDR